MFVLIKILLTFFSLPSIYSQGRPTQLFNYFTERCCAGTVHEFTTERPINKHYCCGTEIYEMEAETAELVSKCCQDKLHKEVPRTTWCCGTEVYDNTTQACYRWDEWGDGQRNKVVNLTEDEIIEGKREVCGQSEDEREIYNPDERICCSGAAYDKKDDWYCCGQLYISWDVSQCCWKLVKDQETKRWMMNTSVIHHNGLRPNWSECCGEVLYNAGTQECCGGVVVNFPKNFTKYYSKDFSKYFQNEEMDWTHSDCCGTQLLENEDTHMCVDNMRIINKTSPNQIWCGGQLHNISGNEPLNVYCDDDDILELKQTEWMCYVNGSKIKFDDAKQVCGDNELIDRIEIDVEKHRISACYPSWDRYARTVFPDFIYRSMQMNNNSKMQKIYIDNTL